MALSLRLPSPLESEILAYSTRTGLSKSAVIVHSIEAFLRSNTQPSAFDLYEEAMRNVSGATQTPTAPDQRPHKQAIADAIQRKHDERSARALQAWKQAPSSRKKAA
jgi:predicted DNA-binding protein